MLGVIYGGLYHGLIKLFILFCLLELNFVLCAVPFLHRQHATFDFVSGYTI